MLASPTPRTPVGMAGVSDFDDYGVDHGDVERGGHSVVEEGEIVHATLGVHVVLLIEAPADALDAAALHLAFHVGRGERLCLRPGRM